MKRAGLWLLVVFLVPLVCEADISVKEKADQAWAARENPRQVMTAIRLYQELADKDPDDFDSRVKVAMSVYWLLEELEYEMDKDEKVRLYDRAINGCNQILEKDEDNVAAWHWLIWDMGALTLVKGIFSGWNLREAIVGTIMVAKGDADFHYGGVYLYWGRVIYETPGLMGRFLHFTDEDSVWLYEKAIEVEPRYLRSHYFLGETYEKLGRTGEAKKQYQYCVDTPDDVLPGMEPETRLYKKRAGKKLADM